MADPTEKISRDEVVATEYTTAVIKSSEELVYGGYAAISANTGLVEFADVVDYLIPVGVVKKAVHPAGTLTGNAGGDYSVSCKAGGILKGVSVAGASAATDTGKLVWATDGQTLTMTKPTTGIPFGFIRKWSTSTTCDVQSFDYKDGIFFSFIPRKRRIFLGLIHSLSLEGTSAIDLLTWTADCRCTIDDLYAYPALVDAGLVAGEQTANLEIGTTDLTGGVITLGFADVDAADALTTKVQATAITATNACNEGDVVTLELVESGTGFTASQNGAYAVYIEISPLPGG